MARALLIALLFVTVVWIGHTMAPMIGMRRSPTPAVTLQKGEAGQVKLPDVPRPPQSKRVYSMVSPERPPKVIQRYASDLATPALIEFYRHEMPRYGWKESRIASGRNPNFPGTVLWYSNSGGNWCMINISNDERGGTIVNLMTVPRAAMERGTPVPAK